MTVAAAYIYKDGRRVREAAPDEVDHLARGADSLREVLSSRSATCSSSSATA